MSIDEITAKLSDTIKTDDGYFGILYNLLKQREAGQITEETYEGVSSMIDQILANGQPIPERKLWGDKNPCAICGVFGHSTTPFGNTSLCKKHYDWYMEEYHKFHVPEAS